MVITLFWLLAAHFLGDFPCQSNWMAQNKWHRWDALLLHVTIYSLILLIVAAYVLGVNLYVVGFVAANFVLHGSVDFFTSKIIHRLAYLPTRRHELFCVVGFDQLLHQTSLLLTLQAYLNITH